jgi:hypothetical protein
VNNYKLPWWHLSLKKFKGGNYEEERVSEVFGEEAVYFREEDRRD